MLRSAFLAGSTALLAAPHAKPTPMTIAVGDLVERFQGIVGIYTRTLDPSAPPPVAVRATDVFPAASIIKLTIMLTTYRAYEAGTLSPSDTITLLPGDITAGAPILGDASSGQRWPVNVLVDAMIKYSDNTASNALISHLGFARINHTIRLAGMTNTVLARHFADVVPPGRRNLNATTPRDVGVLLYEIERGAHEGLTTVASAKTCRAMIELMLGQEYREMIPAGVTRKVPIANKTGELDFVRSDAAIVDPFGDYPYIEVILTRDLDYPGLAYGDIAAIAHRIDNGMPHASH